MKQKMQLELQDVKRIAQAAEAEANANGWAVTIAIVDDGGHLVLLHRLDGTQSASADISVLKARTAAAFKRPTKALEDAIARGKTGMLAIPGLVPLEGGLPLMVAGDLVGAIGVSGVQSFEDGIVAKAGADVLATLA